MFGAGYFNPDYFGLPYFGASADDEPPVVHLHGRPIKEPRKRRPRARRWIRGDEEERRALEIAEQVAVVAPVPVLPDIAPLAAALERTTADLAAIVATQGKAARIERDARAADEAEQLRIAQEAEDEDAIIILFAF